ncbi:MAG: prepilin-type N-terminal cleavage/methylation domain-containing protein [Acidobacteria bacterium]|nr:prepilin-type N-terminal cleavage/methylation domain-containing protein [Acidobacteriota bacterium]
MYPLKAAGSARKEQQGFSLIELMITLAILLSVSAIVLSMTYDMTVRQASVANRSDMHSSVRSVTQMLQQEISQAGRIAWPPTDALCGGAGGCRYPFTTLAAAVAGPANPCPPGPPGDPFAAALTVNDPEVLFNGIRLLVDLGDCQEVVAFDAATGNATFKFNHAAGAEVRPAGAFGEGILPTSTGTVLQMFGDINDDGDMVYVEYVCAPDAAGGTLTRQQVDWDEADPLAAPAPVVLLRNVLPNPDLADGTAVPCFMYQQTDPLTITVDDIVYGPFSYYLNVGVTLTAKAEFDDMQTGAEQVETKALLNVSPRNVFQAWELSTMNGTRRSVQPTPPTITTLAQ